MITIPDDISGWLALPVIVLLVSGSLVTLIGSIGLLRLPYFYQRMHGPAISITFGTVCIVLASMVFFSVLTHSWVVHGVLIIVFVLLTAPVSAMLLMRAAVYRDLRNTNKRYTENLHQASATTPPTAPTTEGD